MRKLIEDERARLREVRTAHVKELASRTELESFLRDCLADVKKQITRHKMESLDKIAQTKHNTASSLHETEDQKEERDRVLELLLSQERVITLLFEKTFPDQASMKLFGGPRLKREMDTNSTVDGSMTQTDKLDASTYGRDSSMQDSLSELNMEGLKLRDSESGRSQLPKIGRDVSR
mmetsp:Transcript_3451/g.11932  ORF Transcript_3451/g.11932 Transcript_3451/m.11932 type:complete len:177 (+) Transcript_3451:1425-1955(+)